MVIVDSRIELMSVIQLLSEYSLVSRLETKYKNSVSAHFGSLGKHPAVKRFSELSADGFDFNNVPDAFIALTEPPFLTQRWPAKEEVVISAGGSESYDQFLNFARDFARQGDFNGFFASNRSSYKKMITGSKPAIRAAIESLESYLGLTLGTTQVILGPLLHDGGFATSYVEQDGQISAYAFLGPSEVVKERPCFGTAERLQPLVAHEFAHTVVNPLTASYAVEVSNFESNFVLLTEAMTREGYSNWEQVVNESIIRAITARMVALEFGSEASEVEVSQELERGFVYVPALIEKLKNYESKRPKFPTIAEYYPELLRVLRELPNAAI